MGLCHFVKIWFTFLTNQPFKTLLGASKFLKIHGHVPAISPLSKYFSAPLPLKIVIPGSIYYPLIFDFLSGPFVKSYSLQL